MKTCPECLSEIPEPAEVCYNCTNRIEGRECPACMSLLKPGARKCKWCGHEFEKASRVAEFEPFTISADFLGTFFLRHRFLTQKIQLNREKIIITTPGLFGLSSRDEEIPWQKVAGFDYRSGIIWDLVQIETRGQSASVMSCLGKRDGERIRAILQQLEQ